MTIYSTGSTGSIGRHLPSVKSLDINLLEHERYIRKELIQCAPDVVIHLAAVTDHKEIDKNPEYSNQVNVVGTKKLYDAFASNGGKKFVFISSGHVYGRTDFGRFLTEDDDLNPLTTYAVQKAEVESYLLEKSKDSGVQIIILRVFSVVGTNMAGHYFASNILKSQKFEPVKNALDVRDFLPVSTVAKMIYSVANASKVMPIILNICSGVPSRIKDKVFDLNPTWPPNSFIDSHSELPWLVGNPSLFKEYFGSEEPV
jgi:nucleoside-diphosphate-sugar epimerase